MSSQAAEDTATEQLRRRNREFSILNTIPQALHRGIGFASAAVPDSSFGIVGINERARSLGGTMGVESSEGIGTRIEVRVPLPNAGARVSEGS